MDIVRSAGSTIVANVAVATGAALSGTPRSFVLNLFFIIYKGRYYHLGARGKLSKRGSYISYMLYPKCYLAKTS